MSGEEDQTNRIFKRHSWELCRQISSPVMNYHFCL